MRSLPTIATLLLALSLGACSGIETRPTGTETFAAGDYQYYRWRSEPLANPTGSTDSLYLMDPIVRREVNANLSGKGYVLNVEKAQFSVDYLQATALREGVNSQDASGGIDPIPSARPNRQINQAMVDNAYALGGVQTTNNIAIQFNDTGSQQEVWRVVITKIVENINETDRSKIEKSLSKAISQGMRTLPKVD